jgi:hypothetical protein
MNAKSRPTGPAFAAFHGTFRDSFYPTRKEHVMRTRDRAIAVLLALSSLTVIAPVGLSFADTPDAPAQAKEAKTKPQPSQSAPPTTEKAKANAARKAAQARMVRCRLHPEICVQ